MRTEPLLSPHYMYSVIVDHIQNVSGEKRPNERIRDKELNIMYPIIDANLPPDHFMLSNNTCTLTGTCTYMYTAEKYTRSPGLKYRLDHWPESSHFSTGPVTHRV